jgi:phage terminase large subunit
MNGLVTGTQPITWDSAEPKSIAELKLHGVNALHAKKGPDSVLHGIQWLKQQTLIFDTTCTYHRDEFSMLKWKEDRKTGQVLDEPVGEDHLIDARRYGSEQDMIPRAKARQYEA